MLKKYDIYLLLNSGYKKFQKYFLFKIFETNMIKALKKVMKTDKI